MININAGVYGKDGDFYERVMGLMAGRGARREGETAGRRGKGKEEAGAGAG